MSRAFVALGSNLDGPERQVRSALAAMNALPGTVLIGASSFYRSAPIGPAGQPDYINAVAELDTSLDPFELLEALQGIEAAHGRIRGRERWGPRTLDLDLLLYEDLVIRDRRLQLPHPEMANRNFVLRPLLEIAPDLAVPGLGSGRQLLERVGDAGIERLPHHD
jgi:2-amino-4-hydroxy-6-hydroxymethyldihydropteridine diphosphokinase